VVANSASARNTFGLFSNSSLFCWLKQKKIFMPFDGQSHDTTARSASLALSLTASFRQQMTVSYLSPVEVSHTRIWVISYIVHSC